MKKAKYAKRNPENRLFAFWFSSGAFDSKWSLVQLESFVTVAPKAGAQHGVIEQLADICGSDPLRSARIVGALVDGDDEGWRIAASQDKAQEVLRIALEAGGEAKDEAEQVIDRLGRRGFVEFGGLLEIA